MHYFIYLLVFMFFMACSSSSVLLSKTKSKVIQKSNYDIDKMYEGYSFDVYINGEKVLFSDSSIVEKSLDKYSGSKKSIVWKLENSIKGTPSIKVEAIDNLTSYIGYLKPNNFEVAIFPLQKVHLNSKKVVEAREDVLVNGSPMLTQINLLEKTKLPSGEYVLKIKVRGTENWDRKEIYIKVENQEESFQERGVFAPFAWYTLALGKHQGSSVAVESTIKLASNQEVKKLKQISKSLEEYKGRREFSKALLYQNKLTAYYEDSIGKESFSTSGMYSNQALLHEELGEYEEALKYNQKSLAINLKYFPKEYAAISVNYDNMGIVYYGMGKYAKAIKMLKKSLELREVYFPKKDASLADSYNNLAIAFEHIGNHKESLNNLKKALKIRQETVGEKHETTASVYSAMGSVYESIKQYEKAKHFHEKSIRIHEEVLGSKAKTEALASAYGAMGTLQHKLVNYEQAIQYYMKMLSIRKNIISSKRLNLSEVYNNMGVSYMHLDKFEESKKYLEKAIEVKKNILGINNNTLQEEYKNLGWLYFGNQNYKEAYGYAKQSIEMLLSQRDDYFPVLDSLEYEHFIKSNQTQMDLLFQCTYYLGDKKSYEDTFSYWLQYKGAMLDNQNRITTGYGQKANEETKKKIQNLLKYQRGLSKLYQHKVQENSATILALEIKEHKEEIKNLREELSAYSKPIAINVDKLVENLDETELYIDFARVGKYYFGFSIDAEKEIFFRRISIKNTKKIDKNILSFRKEMKYALNENSTKQESKKRVSELYDTLLKKLLETFMVKKTKLIISADGLLRLLPFEALYSTKKKKYLIEYKQLQYIPSAREFLRLKATKQTKKSNNKIVVFANPDFDEGMIDKLRSANNRMFEMDFSNLKGTQEEAKSIKKIMHESNVVSYEGVDANEDNFFNVKQPQILHIATHGFFIKSELSNPMLNAGIVLTGANSALKRGRGDGVITALKLSGMNLQGTELVVLSACETGLVGLHAPDSVSLLSKAFMQAGAQGVVASLWSVSDAGTKELMELFYREIEKGLPYVEALKKAKIEMIKRGVSPAIWSAFIFNGDE